MTQATEPVTVVVFRRWRDTKNVIALFPNEAWNAEGHCASYMSVGQHAGADYQGVIRATKPAFMVDDDVAALYRELASAPYFYRLNVRQRRVRA